MVLEQFLDNPFQIRLSFHKMIERFEAIAASDTGYAGQHAQAILQKVAPYPVLRDGIIEASQIENNTEVIGHLLAELFPPALTLNEIKAITIPYINIVFNHTERFSNIL